MSSWFPRQGRGGGIPTATAALIILGLAGYTASWWKGGAPASPASGPAAPLHAERAPQAVWKPITPHDEGASAAKARSAARRKRAFGGYNEPDPFWHGEALERWVAQLPLDRICALLDEANGNPDALSAELRLLLTRRWAETDPAAAAASITQWPEAAPRIEACRQIAIAWSRSDPSAALGWTRSLPPGEGRTAAQLRVGYESARSDLAVAFQAANELPSGEDQRELLQYCARQWAALHPLDALEWADSVTDPALRASLADKILAEWAQYDGAGAAEALAMEPGVEALRPRGIVALIQRWAQNDPADAADWAGLLPEGLGRDEAIGNLATQWLQSDPAAATDWVQSLPAGSSREAATLALTLALSVEDRGAALFMSDFIESETARTSLQYQLLFRP